MTNAEVLAFDQIHTDVKALRQAIHRQLVGQDEVVDQLIAGVLVGGHTLLIGVPGLAKTMLVRCLAAGLGWDFRRIQFTPDMMPSDVIGTELINESPETGRREMRFVPGPVFTNLLLADEINRTPPRTQAALLDAMAERQVTAAGESMTLDPPFVVVATQNPIEQEGTYPLPEAQLDRFMFSLNVVYPEVADERQIVDQLAPDGRATMSIEPVMDKQKAVQAADLIQRMPVSDHVRDYAVALVRASRPNDESSIDTVKQYVEWGAGPRGGQYLVLGARALAAMENEPTPSIEHVRRIAPAVLSHRVVLSYAAAGDGVTAQNVIGDLIKSVKD